MVLIHSKAGLYSAALSAFLVESYKNLQEDKQDTIVGLLQKIATQSFVSSGAYTNSTTTLSASIPFEPPSWAIHVNVLWFASLVLSIAVASLGILVKQWLREYLAMEYSSPRLRLRARNYRKPALDKWKVFEIASILPMVLQVSVGLFFVGLCVFTSAVHDSVRNTTVPIVCAWAFFFVITTIAPLFSPRCPFKTVFLKRALKAGRRYIIPYVKCIIISIPSHIATLYYKTLHHLCTESEGNTKTRPRPKPEDVLEEEEEDAVASAGDEEDSHILLAVNDVVADDNLLPTMLEVLSLGNPATIVEFVVKFIQQREGIQHLDPENLQFTRKLSTLSIQTWTILVNTIIGLLERNPSASLKPNDVMHSWAMKSAVLLLSQHKSHAGINALRRFIASDSTEGEREAVPAYRGRAELLFSVHPALWDDSLLETMLDLLQFRAPETTVDFVLWIIRHHPSVGPLEGDFTSILDLRRLPSETWSVLVDALADLLTRNREALFKSSGEAQPWAINSTIFLLSHRNDDHSGMQALRTLIESGGAEEAHRAGHGLIASIDPSLINDSLLPTSLMLIKGGDPRTIVDFVLKIVKHRRSVDPLAPKNTSTPTQHVRESQQAAHLSLSHAICTALPPDTIAPLKDIPEWKLEAIMFLLSVPSYDPPKEYARALHQILALDAAFQDSGHTQRFSIADHVFKSWTSTPEFAFGPIARIYASCDHDTASILPPYGVLPHRYLPMDQSIVKVDRTSTPHSSLFNLLIRLLMWRCQRDEELTDDEYKALQAVLEIRVGDARRADADLVSKAYYEHPVHVYSWMFCYSAIQPTRCITTDQSLRTPTYGSFRALFENPYSLREFFLCGLIRVLKTGRYAQSRISS